MSSVEDHDTTGAASVRNRLAGIRRKRGLAAAAVARQAGVSRQTIYAIEAGTYVPNTAVALRLARILEVQVEDLFRLDPFEPPEPRPVRADIIGAGDLFAGSPLELCRVEGRLIGVPAMPVPWQLRSADALLVAAAGPLVQPLRDEDSETSLLIAGCDPATTVLARHLQRSGVRLVTAPVNSSAALRLLKQRLVHVAGTHLKDEGSDESNRSAIHGQFPRRGVAVFEFAVWEEGLVVARGNPKRIRRVEDLARPGVRFVNREAGSGSRQLLDRRLQAAGLVPKQIFGYRDEAAGHLPAAWRLYAGLADCCVATRSAARAFGLDFVPLTSERYDLVLHREHLELATVERLLDTLSQASFRRELEALCGYDTRATGRRVT